MRVGASGAKALDRGCSFCIGLHEKTRCVVHDNPHARAYKKGEICRTWDEMGATSGSGTMAPLGAGLADGDCLAYGPGREAQQLGGSRHVSEPAPSGR